MPNEEGMDNPWRWYTTSVELSNSQQITINLNQGLLGTNPSIPSEVDFLKIALWWFESPASPNAQINVKLMRRANIWSPWTLVKEKNSNDDQKIHFIFDNEEENFDDLATNYHYKLLVTGSFIPTGETREIWATYFWEDLERDDTEGPRHDVPLDYRYLFYR